MFLPSLDALTTFPITFTPSSHSFPPASPPPRPPLAVVRTTYVPEVGEDEGEEYDETVLTELGENRDSETCVTDVVEKKADARE
jgi:hypothetical protein